jgi:hypothetical protein
MPKKKQIPRPKVIVRACPEQPPNWWPLDEQGRPFWVYVRRHYGAGWATIPTPVEDFCCRPFQTKDLVRFFVDDNGPVLEEEDGTEDPGLGAAPFPT